MPVELSAQYLFRCDRCGFAKPVPAEFHDKRVLWPGRPEGWATIAVKIYCPPCSSHIADAMRPTFGRAD